MFKKGFAALGLYIRHCFQEFWTSKYCVKALLFLVLGRYYIRSDNRSHREVIAVLV